jgi:hypothetical protein
MPVFVRRSAVYTAKALGWNLQASLNKLWILLGSLSYPFGHVHGGFMVYANELF